MKKSLLTAAVCCLLIAPSCKKEEKKEVYDLTKAKVRSVTHSKTGLSEIYSYDTQGRIAQWELGDGRKITYTYSNDTIMQISLDAGGVVLATDMILLDTLGLAKNRLGVDNGGQILSYHNYTFNYEKQLTSLNEFDESYIAYGKTEWIWNQGNMIQQIIYDSTTVNKLYDIYVWYYDPAGTSIGNVNTGKSFLGADSKYLVRKIIKNSVAFGNSLYTYQYDLDGQQRIVAVRTYDYQDDLINTDSYTYY